MQQWILYSLLFLLTLCSITSATPQAGERYCWVTSPYGNVISVLSQSEYGRAAQARIASYTDSGDTDLKFLVKFPSDSRHDKSVHKMSFPFPVHDAATPFSFSWDIQDPINSGLASVKIKGNNGSCVALVYLVDNGFESIDIGQFITDFNTFDSAITVKGVDTIQKVRVSLTLEHTYVADLNVSLIGPDGTTVALVNLEGGDQDNFGSGFYHTQRTVFDDDATATINSSTAPFVGTFAPYQPLSAFNGKYGNAANGTWALRVTDERSGDSGILYNWALIIDDAPGTKVTWYGRLTLEQFLAAGYTPTPEQEAKLLNTSYSLQNIVSGWTDRLVDGAYCTGCHTGSFAQLPGRYFPNYLNMSYAAAHWKTAAHDSSYTWSDATTQGLIYQFRNNTVNKPPGLKAIFQKWLDDGAVP